MSNGPQVLAVLQAASLRHRTGNVSAHTTKSIAANVLLARNGVLPASRGGAQQFSGGASARLQVDLSSTWERVAGGVFHPICTPQQSRQALGIRTAGDAQLHLFSGEFTVTPATASRVVFESCCSDRPPAPRLSHGKGRGCFPGKHPRLLTRFGGHFHGLIDRAAADPHRDPRHGTARHGTRTVQATGTKSFWSTAFTGSLQWIDLRRPSRCG